MTRILDLALCLTLAFLGSRGQRVYDCPTDWAAYGDHCYHFVFYPTLPFDEASQACHQDGASLVSINTAEENNFLVQWLGQYDGSRLNQWYTSGLQKSDGTRAWTGDGDSMSAQDTFWLDAGTEAALANTFSGAHLVYRYHITSDDTTGESGRFAWTWAGRTLALPYVCEIARAEVYRIFHTDRGFAYGSLSSNPNDWLIGPKFKSLSPNTIFTGRELQFSLDCDATGNPVPTYKWFRDYGTDHETVVNASVRYTVTNGRLTINNPSAAADSGRYTCQAQNVVGKVFSRPVEVSSGTLQEFSNTQPGARRARLYQGAVLDCAAPIASTAVTYQWMKGDRQNIRPEMNPHTFLSQNGNLYFSEVQAADAADYHCQITLEAPPGYRLATSQPVSGFSRGIPLVITGEDANESGPDIHNDFPSVFPEQPLRGQEMSIECLAYGRLPLEYQWSRAEGGPLPADRVTYRSLGRVLVVRDARLEDSGVYTCTVQGRRNVDTRNISITVAAAPYFKFPLRDQHLDVGSRLTWVCDAVAIPPAAYAWYRDGQMLTTDADNDIQVSRNMLTIQSADAQKHNGMYECMATNDHGTHTSIGQIRVLSFAPNFSVEPVLGDLLGTVGGNLTVRCTPQGAPQPSITWTRNGQPLGGGHTQVMDDGNLVLTFLTAGDAGTYTCTADNGVGTAESSGTLTILEKTTLTHVPGDQQVRQNSSAHVMCQASFNERTTDLVYAWYFNGKLLEIDRRPEFSVSTVSGVKGLYIVGAQYEHEGFYECRATTVYDSVSAQAYLTVHGPPDEPAGVHRHIAAGTGVTLWWQRGQTHGEDVALYRVQYNSNFNPDWRVLVSEIEASQTQVTQYPTWRQYVIEETLLSPGTSYQFRVLAASPSYGFGRPSLPSDPIKMDDAPPNYAPEFVTGGGGSVGMLEVKWLPLPPEQHGGNDLYYKVFWRLHRNPDDMWTPSEGQIWNRVDRDGYVRFHQKVGEVNFYTQYDVKVQSLNAMGPGPNTSVHVVMSAEDRVVWWIKSQQNGLDTHMQYGVKVQSLNAMGPGTNTSVYVVMSAEGIPVSTPQNVAAEGINSTAGLVTWDLPNNTRDGIRGKVQGYQLNWYHWGQENTKEIIKFKRNYGEEREATIIGLYPNEDYWCTVQVFNTAGLSRASGRAYLNPNYDAPQHYPQHVTVQSHGPDSVYVTWRGVSTTQEEYSVSGYKIWYWPYTDNIRTAQVAEFGKVFSGVLYGLEKDKIYQMRVLGTNAGGDGKKTPPTLFTLGGQVRFDPTSSEVMASAGIVRVSLFLLLGVSVLCRYL